MKILTAVLFAGLAFSAVPAASAPQTEAPRPDPASYPFHVGERSSTPPSWAFSGSAPRV
jgi:hypothetical protein